MSHVIVEVAVELELEGASLVVALHEGEVAFPLEEVQLQGAVPCEEVEVASFQEASYLWQECTFVISAAIDLEQRC